MVDVWNHILLYLCSTIHPLTACKFPRYDTYGAVSLKWIATVHTFEIYSLLVQYIFRLYKVFPPTKCAERQSKLTLQVTNEKTNKLDRTVSGLPLDITQASLQRGLQYV